MKITKNGQEIEKPSTEGNLVPNAPEKKIVAKNLIEKHQQDKKNSSKKLKIKKDGLELKEEIKEPKKVVLTTTSDEKVSLSYSRLRNYIICPKRFEYHTKYGWTASDQTKETMQGGLIFEAIVLGDKNLILDSINPDGKKHKKIIDQANAIKQQGLFGEGEAYVKLSYEHELFTIRGEGDFIGGFKIDDFSKRLIVDLKFTGKIDYIWQDFKYKEDALQLILYSWMWYKETGEMLDAAYMIVESTYNDPVYQIRKIAITLDTYEWVEKFLIKVAVEPVKLTNPNQKNCLGGKGKPRCAWLEYCSSGRSLLGGIQQVESDLLPSLLTDNNIVY